MYLTMRWQLPYVVTFLIGLPASALLVRIFIFVHDCGHGSYVKSPVWQKIIGTVLGVLTFVSLADWTRQHGIHHSTSGNLDRRGIGDVWTMTLAEYEASSPFRRLQYRLFRNPFIMFGLGPILSFLIRQRVPTPGAKRKQVLGVILTDLAIAGIVVACAFTIGIKAYLLIQLPVILIAGSARRLALLRPAPVRPLLLGAIRGMGIHGRRHAGIVPLQAAKGAAVDLR